jgi:hypothetical protein
MAVLGVEAALLYPIDDTEDLSEAYTSTTEENVALHLLIFAREGSHVEPTIGQIWPRLA